MTSQLKTGQLGGNKFIVMWEEVAKIALQNKTPSYSQITTIYSVVTMCNYYLSYYYYL